MDKTMTNRMLSAFLLGLALFLNGALSILGVGADVVEVVFATSVVAWVTFIVYRGRRQVGK